MTEERSPQFAVVIGASPLAEAVRRSFVRRGLPHAGTAAHLRGLRRSLVLGECESAVLCIALDEATLDQYGHALRGVLQDQSTFASPVCSVGILPNDRLTPELASLGCHVYVQSPGQATDVVRVFDELDGGPLQFRDVVATRFTGLAFPAASLLPSPDATSRSGRSEDGITPWGGRLRDPR